jgi:hypothetical protein
MKCMISLISGVVFLLAGGHTLAQGSVPGVDIKFQDMVKEQRVGLSTAGNEFGDQHSLYSGQLALNNVDVSIPGNNALQVEFRRTISLTTPEFYVFGFPLNYYHPRTRMGNWFFALPRIEADYDFRAGWSTSDTARPKANCSIASSNAMMPKVGIPEFYPANYNYGLDSVFHPKRYWRPPSVIWPEGSSELLLYNAGRIPAPATGGPFYWVTSESSYVSCLPQLKNRATVGEEGRFGDGEGFLVHRADGTKYWFDWMALEQVLPLSSNVMAASSQAQGPTPVRMHQAKLALYVTRVEDRFGNWVTYSYSNKANEMVKLDSITSSDGRAISVTYVNGLVSTVSDGSRSWTYIGTDRYLQEVINPDSSKWQYQGTVHYLMNWPAGSNGTGRCQNTAWTTYVNPDRTVAHSADFTGYSVTNPAGAKATFRVEGVMLGRSAVQKTCIASGFADGGSTQILHPHNRLGDYSPALVSKKIEGAGLTTNVWSYNYQSDISFTNYVTGVTTVKIRDPGGTVNVKVFGNRAGYNEGLLLEEKVITAGVEAQKTTYEYALADAGETYIRMPGTHPLWLDNSSATLTRPKTKQTILRDGRSFIWEAPRSCGSSLCLDVFGRPTRISRSSN